VVELLYQIDLCVQLVIQNFLLATNEEVKFKTYDLLFKIVAKKDFVMSFLACMPSYHIYLSNFKLESGFNNYDDSPTALQSKYINQDKYSLYYEAKPQMSILQSPLLEFANFFVEIKRKYPTKEKLKQILLELCPLVNKLWIPIFKDSAPNQLSSRTKFTYVDESLLLIGLTKYGSKKLELIQENFLSEKTLAEIKNRYKNFICSRASDNPLKRWKILQFSPLTADEKLALGRGVEWFGSYEKLQLICRYFLTDRTPDYLKGELTNSEKLQRKREKHVNLLDSSMDSDYTPPAHIAKNEREAVKKSTDPSGIARDNNTFEMEEENENNDINFEKMELELESEDDHETKPDTMIHRINNFTFETDQLVFDNSDSLIATRAGYFKSINSIMYEYEEI
jgi:hypothetical protein